MTIAVFSMATVRLPNRGRCFDRKTMQFGPGFIYLREYLSVTAVPITVLPLAIGRYEKENHESFPFSIQRLHSRTPILVRQPTHRIQ
jgi:hypothetical protein